MSLRTQVERLEQRTLLAGNQIHFNDFSSTTNLVGNGFSGDPITSASHLRMTNDVDHEARSVWFGTAVPITNFRTDFTFRINASATSAETRSSTWM